MLLNDEENFIDDELEDESEDDGVLRVTRKGTLTKFIRAKSEFRISGECKEVLMAELDQLAMMLIKRATELSKEEGRQTIMSRHIEAAYEELLRPHSFIQQIVQTLEEQKEQLKVLAQSSLVRHMEVD